MTRFAAICAFPAKLNTGMISVEAALQSLASRLPAPVDLNLFCVEKAHELPARDPAATLKYHHLSDVSQLQGYDRILIWGDFLHARKYQINGLAPRARELHGPDYKVHLKRMGRLLRMTEADPELLSRVLCVGGSIYINDHEDECDRAYIEPTARLFRNARLVMMRDPVSAHYAQRYSHREDGTIGLDCSLLLHPYGPYKWRAADTERGADYRICFSFGRRLAKNPTTMSAMQDFVQTLAQHMNAGCVTNLSWLSRRTNAPIQGVCDKLKAIRRSNLVVTDTYHCAINAWREGVPAICIGSGAEDKQGTLSDKKKELFFSMFNLGDLYVYSEKIGSPGERQALCERITTLLSTPYAVSASESIAQYCDYVERRVVTALLG